MRYTYQIIVKSEHPEAIITNTINKLEDSFTVESIEEVNDETPPDEAIIKEIPFLYV